MSYLMGIDLGTSSLKVLIMNELGDVKALSVRAYQFETPRPGFAEQDTAVWWEACCLCIKSALLQLGANPAEVKGVSFSGQMHGLVMLDSDLRVIRPSILHCDSRSGVQIEEINSLLGKGFILENVLNPIYTGFLLPSLMWVRENEPDNFEKVRHVLLPKDYIRFMLTGELSSDYSDASATLAFDIEKGCWSSEIIGRMNLDMSIFPICHDTVDVVGYITPSASRATGLNVKTLVIAGGGDQVMQCIGNGASGTSTATVNIGTSGQVCFQSDRVIKNPLLSTNTFCGYKVGRWITMGATMSAGLSLKWFSNLFGKADYQEADREIEKIVPGSEGLIFLPYLNGERTPHINPNLSASFIGLNLRTSKRHMTRAVMEGVAYSLKQCMEECGYLGLSVDSLVASGGGAQSGTWLQIQADIYNKPLRVAAVDEQASIGAAIAAGVGSGIYKNIDQACGQVVKYKDRIYLPQQESQQIYSEYYELFKETYQASRVVLEKITKMGRNHSGSAMA